VPFGAGGPADVYARVIGQHLQSALGQPFIIENRPGGGAVNGTVAAGQAPADGYTLLMMSNTHTANETLIPNRGYELLRNFVPIAPVNAADLVIVVNNDVPARTLEEFLALARSRPGTLNYASSGNGTPYHMAGELFKALSRTDIQHVPYRSSGSARSDVIAGHAQMMIDAVSATAPAVIGGQVRALATTGRTRTSVLPNVPTAIEAGLPGLRGEHLARPDGAGRHAGADRGPAQRRGERLPAAAGDAAGVGGPRGLAARHDARRVRDLSARRHREMGDRHPHGQHSRRVTR
jgi:tripartite-type tricarboxylate transporter receptor subunit TctC